MAGRRAWPASVDFGAVLGTSLEYVNVDERQWREWARARGWDGYAIEQRVTGRRPESVREFLRAAG
jgi:hypothetical protein